MDIQVHFYEHMLQVFQYQLQMILCSWFSGINPLIGFEPLIFELSTFIFGKGKREKKPLREFGSGGWFRGGKVLSTLHDYGTP